MSRLAVLVLSLCILPVAFAQPSAKRPMQVDDLFRFKRVSDPQISPDGKHVVYAQATVDLAGNRSSSALWIAPTDSGEPKPFTKTDKRDSHPRWSPDGRHILFVSNRSGSSQLWIVAAEGGEPRQLTTLSTEASTGIWSRDGKMIAFVSAVWPEFSEKPFAESDSANKQRIDERAKNPVKAKVFTRLFMRHWDEYVEDKRQHLFVMSFADGKAGEPRDVTPGDRDAYPTSSTFSVGDDFTFSPDGKYVVLTAVPEKNEAWSTNYDICRVPVTGGTPSWECLTKDNPAADGTPVFSPDGKKMAYRAQKRAGFEADRWDLLVVDVDESGAFRGTPKSAVAKLSESVDEYAWATIWSRGVADTSLLFAAEEKGFRQLFALSPEGLQFRSGLSNRGTIGDVSVSKDGKRFAFAIAKMNAPPEVYVHSLSQAIGVESSNLSHANGKLLAQLELPRPESVTVPGAGGTPMQMWILKPPGFDATKKWPLAFLVHGGPQGAWTDGWSYRWNPQVWAAQGYVVALPNPRGSTGFGQKYVDEISGDWGGKVYEDLMAGVAYLEKQPYIDSTRMAAAGASYGGYMMNWFAVNTGKFKTLINHCGVWNFDSMYATTEELWFDEWEHGGPPWGKNRHSYEKHSPHRFAANLAKFKTPMLIIHNDLDFRVPISEGIQVFTTLQRLGVPSRMVNFPDEGHWVLRPANSKYWHDEVFTWLKKHVTPGGK